MKTGIDFAECALSEKWNRYKYSSLDCQGFVEAVLKEIGVRKANGKPYDWRGSNSMYRNFYSWRGTVEECQRKFGDIPIGSFVYIWEPTGEQEVGYTDGLGNAKHVGIYCGYNVVRDSTRNSNRDGVGTRTMKGFNRVTLFDGLSYSIDESGKDSYNASVEGILSLISECRNILNQMEVLVNDIVRH